MECHCEEWTLTQDISLINQFILINDTEIDKSYLIAPCVTQVSKLKIKGIIENECKSELYWNNQR